MTLLLPKLVAAGDFTFSEDDPTLVEGDSTTLAEIVAGMDVIIDYEPPLVLKALTDAESLTADSVVTSFTLAELWSGATGSDPGYVVTTASLSDDERAALETADAIDEIANLGDYASEAEGFQLLSIDGDGDAILTPVVLRKILERTEDVENGTVSYAPGWELAYPDLTFPAMTYAGAVSVTIGEITVEGDSDTLATVLATHTLFVNRSGVTVSADVDTDAESAALQPLTGVYFTLESGWPLNEAQDDFEPPMPSGAVDGYWIDTSDSDVGAEIFNDCDAIGLFSERDDYDSEPVGFVFGSIDGAGSEERVKIYRRDGFTAGTWEDALNLTYYVNGASGMGDDANSGATAAEAVATIQRGADLIAEQNIAGRTATLYVANESYLENIVLPEVQGFEEVGQLRIVFESGATIEPASGIAIYAKDITAIWKIVGADFA